MPKQDTLFLGAPSDVQTLTLDTQVEVYNGYKKNVPDPHEKIDIHDLFKDYSKNLKKQPGYKDQEKQEDKEILNFRMENKNLEWKMLEAQKKFDGFKMQYGTWDIKMSAKKVERVKLRYEQTLDKQIKEANEMLPQLEVKYSQYQQGMKFVEYFEDIEALKNKIECCNIEIEN